MSAIIIIETILLALHAIAATIAVGHILLNKSDPRSAWGWGSFCIIFPLIGPLGYLIFGINRVRTRARKLDLVSRFRLDEGYGRFPDGEESVVTSSTVPEDYQVIAKISDSVTRLPLVGGNRVEMLQNGEEVYPAMIEAIDAAVESVYLITYIFETNESGHRIIDALCRAKKRGADVKVIIDGVGEFYDLPRAGTVLKKRGVSVARFIPPKLYPPTLHINLRNHRKVLVTDGKIAFTGGMNIGDRHLADNLLDPDRFMDTHFRLKGPVVKQIEAAFLDDWAFTTGQFKKPGSGIPEPVGRAICRTIVDGPNEDPDKLTMVLAGAISSAHHRVYIMTPYFLPSREIVSALQVAALKGVAVHILLPGKNNIRVMQWAANNFLWKLMQWGVKVFFQPAPFVHSKLLVVDDFYSNIGSANVDPRSLRLNFELNVEIFDREMAQAVAAHMEECAERSLELTLEDLENRNIVVKLRDAAAWLFSPYL